MRPVMAKAIGYMQPTIDPNVRLYVPFNEGVGSVAKDYSQYCNHVQLTNVEWSSDGFNGAGKFNGNSSFGASGIPRFNVTHEFLASEAEGQQGITTDGTYVYVSTNALLKYDMNGNYIGASSASGWHFGGIVYHEEYIYVAVSECTAEGTSKHWVYKYNTSLEKIAEYDIGSYFTICAGAITYCNDHFYVAESYFDNNHFDRIVRFDASFNFVETITTNQKSNYGIQGIEYIPSKNLFQINSHGTGFYRIDTAFANSSIKTYNAPFSLQDVAYLNSLTSLYNDRSAQKVKFVDTALYQTFDDILSSEYIVKAWFNVKGGIGERRGLFESTPTWSISCEITSSNLLQYSILTTGSSIIKATNIQPPLDSLHSVSILYKENDYSKIFYDFSELSNYAGSPTGLLYGISKFHIGTYRSANARWFHGLLSSVIICALAESPAQIAADRYEVCN